MFGGVSCENDRSKRSGIGFHLVPACKLCVLFVTKQITYQLYSGHVHIHTYLHPAVRNPVKEQPGKAAPLPQAGVLLGSPTQAVAAAT